MYYVIYKITNIINGYEYIGKHQTKKLDDGYLGSGKLISKDIKKYGKQNFSKEILHVFEKEEDMNAKEMELVTEDYCGLDTTYNLCPGGKGGWGYINNRPILQEKGRLKIKQLLKTDEEWKKEFLQKQSASRQHFMESSKWKEYLERRKRTIKEKYPEGIKPFLGKKHSEETKLKMSVSKKETSFGDKNSQYGTMWITNGIENKKIKKTNEIPLGWHKGRKI